MTITEELSLSFYRELCQLDKEHEVTLVKNIQTGCLYVKKSLTVYDAAVYRYLLAHPVPGTPRIYEAVEDGDTLTVIEELVNGESLQHRLERGPLPEAEAVEITAKLCRTVWALHRCTPPIVHRDIKPGNIFLLEDGSVYLLDMNAAKQNRGEAEQDTRLIGTAGYAAPEQYGFGSSTEKTDIYAIGVLMATLTRGAFSRQALTDSPYDKIVEKCTRLDPSDRYASAEAILAALRPLIGEPETSKTPEAKPARRFLPPGFRRGKPLSMIVAAIMYTALIAMAFSRSSRELGSPLLHVLDGCFFFLAVFSAALVMGNYLDVWTALGLMKIRQKWLRAAAAVLCGVLAFFLVALLWVSLLTALS